ncbi:MAG: M3 family metallopeptidase, partial [Sandaracinaceae bacterium]|nr:M3 family metallopeptidase [Sandaracinaceae bacterium]
IAEAKAHIESIAPATSAPSYDNVLWELEEASERVSRFARLIAFMESVESTPEWQKVHAQLQPEFSAFFSSIPLNEGLYRRLCALAHSSEVEKWDAVRRRHLQKNLEFFRIHGAGLDAASKARLIEIDRELAKLTAEFGSNVVEASAAFELVIEEEARLSGLPESAKTYARQRAKERGQEGYRFGLEEPLVFALLRYAEDESLRRVIWLAHQSRAKQKNLPLIERILELRMEKARLLGKKDFAELVGWDRMLKGGEQALSFLSGLESRMRPLMERERLELERFAREHGCPSLKAWDIAFWSERLRKRLYDFDEEALRPYFEAGRVLEGAFEIAHHLFGLRFVQVSGFPTWHPDVLVYEAHDEERGLLGYAYVDLFPRENKRSGAWMSPLLIGGPRPYASFVPHVAAVVANLSPPSTEGVALLLHEEVETLFHEIGHLVHQLLSQVPIPSLAGTNVAWDFVELPSQFFENFAWEPEALQGFARHYQNGEPISLELIARKRKARFFRAATAHMRQIGYAILDLELHRGARPKEGEGIDGLARRILSAFVPFEIPAEEAMVASFLHLFADPVGYAAGYYSYKWAEVLEADVWNRFAEEGILSQALGRAFRRAILERGDTAEPMELFIDFLGRPPRIDALVERLDKNAQERVP